MGHGPQEAFKLLLSVIQYLGRTYHDAKRMSISAGEPLHMDRHRSAAATLEASRFCLCNQNSIWLEKSILVDMHRGQMIFEASKAEAVGAVSLGSLRNIVF